MQAENTVIIWDFNGTIFDDVNAGFASANLLLKSRGLGELADIETYREHFRFPVKEYYRSLGFDFDKESFEKLAVQWVGFYMEASRDSKAVSGVYDVIRKFRALGYRQTVISASETEMLMNQLGQLGFVRLFDDIAGTGDIYAHSKKEIALNWRKKHPYDRAVWVGDTVHDYEVAEAVGAVCMLYSGGHETKKRLAKCGCPVFDDMRDLPGLILGIC